MKKYFVIVASLLLAGCPSGWSESYWVHNPSDEKVTVNDTEVEPGECLEVGDSFTIGETEYSEEGHYQWDGSEAKKVSAEDVAAVCGESEEGEKEEGEKDGEKDGKEVEQPETPATPAEAEEAAKAAAAAAVAAAEALDAGIATYKAVETKTAEHIKPARELAWDAKNAGEQAKAAGEAEGVSAETKTAVTDAVAAVDASLAKAKEAGITPAFKPPAKS